MKANMRKKMINGYYLLPVKVNGKGLDVSNKETETSYLSYLVKLALIQIGIC